MTLAACGSETAGQVDTTATYDAYGALFEPGLAVPAHAVLAEPDAFTGRAAIVDGAVAGDCADADCIASIAADGGRIDVFFTGDELDSLRAADGIAGRRIVAAGSIRAAEPRSTAERNSRSAQPDQGTAGDTASDRNDNVAAAPLHDDIMDENRTDADTAEANPAASAAPVLRLDATGIMIQKTRH